MKKRMLALFCLCVICAGLLCGCRCKPYKTNWYVQSFQKEAVFVTGGEFLLAQSGYPSVRDPFAGMKDGFVSISFSEDGKVVFEPGTGEVLAGRYTYAHKGTVETKVFVTLDNGETFTCTARSNGYGSSLTCTFRERDYLFEDTQSDPREYYEQCVEDVCKSIRYWCQENEGAIPLKICTITMVKDYYVLSSDALSGPVKLDETLAVRCFRMDGNNELHMMDAIELGECYFMAENFNDMTYITLYYVEFP